MQPFVHLHVHSQYSILDGQASITGLVDKAINDGMKGIAITDHGNMFGIKEFFNYTKKLNGKVKNSISIIKSEISDLENIEERTEEQNSHLVELKANLVKEESKIFKPIFGCEMYVARNGMANKSGKENLSGHHLVVLAKNEKGYHNLIKLVSNSWIDGFYGRPRTEKAELEKYHEGLIICSACLGGELPKKIANNDIDGARETIQWFKRVFGEDYYIELQRHKATAERANRETYKIQSEVNPKLIELAHENGVKLICSNDVHFVNEENAEAHDHLICLVTNKALDDPSRMLYTKQEWMKTQEEMNEVFADIPEALSNTIEILDKVEFYSIDHAPIMPNFEIPKDFGTEDEYRQKYTEKDLFDEFTQDENGNVVLSEDKAKDKIKKLGGYEKLYRTKLEADYLAKLAYDGAKKLYGEPLTPELQERIKFELHIMKTMGFPGYFLIVQDFIAAGRQRGVSIGPGRGSAAGSAVAYCLQITKIDPIKYDLLFERFLNPDRISLPDIDIDFDDDGRAEVLKYVVEKYGYEKVAQIITYGTMATKSVIKDVARVEQYPLPDTDKLVKLIPDHLPEINGKEPKINLKNCIEGVPELKEATVSENPKVRNIMKYAQMLEGNVRNTGVHACGVIISRDDISDWVPVATTTDKQTGEVQRLTQYEGCVIEDTGLIKMDFLGLKTLSIIKDALYNIKHSKGIDVDIDNIPIDDPKTFQLYCAGQTTGTFQFESVGMQKYLKELQPSTFEDLIAMNALYRPGPMKYIPDFIKRKHGELPIVYDIPIMEKYLKDTYGITVYQEQVMLLSRLLAGFTRGQSDGLRKAMGKKIKAKLDELKPLFIKGGEKNGHDKGTLEKIWKDWEDFASYAFNKSHATCYSWVAYQTAYLKANYPAEFMAAVLSRNLNDTTKLGKYMDECKSMDIRVLGPDVNESDHSFGVNKDGNIRFGLAAIKGVGHGAVEGIIEERDKNGTYESIFDFVERVNLSACNRKAIESMAFSGCFDSFSEISREAFEEKNAKNEMFSETLIRYGQRFQTEASTKVASLFDDIAPIEMAKPPIPKVEDWSNLYKLERERDLVGMYLSAHPLDPYRLELEYGCNKRISEIQRVPELKGQTLKFGGIVTSFTRKKSNFNNSEYVIVKIEDLYGSNDIMLFDKDLKTYGLLFDIGNVLYITATIQERKYNAEKLDLKIESIQRMDDIKSNLISSILITIDENNINEGFLEILHDLVTKKSDYPCSLKFNIYNSATQKFITLKSREINYLSNELIDFLKEKEDINFKIN